MAFPLLSTPWPITQWHHILGFLSQVHGDNKSELDFGAVQRGDAEMGNKLNRIIRACIEDGQKNPICSIHDQGAGGNGNYYIFLIG